MLTRIGLRNFRSFGTDSTTVGPFQKINVILGKNNQGKSNLLSAIRCVVQALRKRTQAEPSASVDFRPERERYLGRDCTLGLPLIDDWPKAVARAFPKDEQDVLEVPERNEVFPEGLLWIQPAGSDSFTLVQEITEVKDATYSALRACVNSSYPDAQALQSFQQRIYAAHSSYPKVPQVRFIDAFRDTPARVELAASPEKQNGSTNKAELKPHFRGEETIYHLYRLQNPESTNYSQLAKRFQDFQNFVRQVLEEPTCRISVAWNGELQVFVNDVPWPLDSVGSGVKQLILMAAYLTGVERSIVLIEEPELNLHPRMQKVFAAYLQKLPHQVFFSTHSPSFIDTPDAALFHVYWSKEKACSIVENVKLSEKKFELVTTLGLRASDLLQANCVIWVEGPSDVIYLQKWLSLEDSTLRAGYHFTFAMYGGSNLKSHGVEDDELFRLFEVNRCAFVVCDSDRAKKGAKLKPRVKKIRKQAEESRGKIKIGITQGREIENYVSVDQHNKLRSKGNQLSAAEQEFGDLVS